MAESRERSRAVMDPEESLTGDSEMTRRELLAVLGAGAFVGLATGIPSKLAARTFTQGPCAAVAGGVPVKLSPFSLHDVRLLDGPFLEAQRRDLTYLVSLQPDRMLHNFRVNAGLAPKAPVYGGWESEEPWVEIRCHGHTLGHYLTAASLMYASTGDERMKQRVDYIVEELKACQKAAGTGLVCAFPDGATQLENAVAGRKFVGVPWYTMHKIFAGLLDAHLHAGSAPALEVLTKLADWTANATEGMTDEQFQRMLETEHGGMNEGLANLAALTGNSKYLTLARRFCHQAVLSPLSDSQDLLDGLHANTQIPKVVGFQRLSELTGEGQYGSAARFFWQTVVGRRSFVTGGHGDGEHFFPPADFARHLGSAKTMETCCTHNMLRLTRLIFQDAPSSSHADYYERALYNGILASQDPETGMMTYFQATRPGYVRLFHTREKSFWCCTGTGMENHAKHGDSIYFNGPGALWVNLFIPSVVTWKEMGFTLRQATTFPESPSTRLSVTVGRPVRATLNVRQPGWCSGMTVRVNGRGWKKAAAANGYVAIDREWRTGDVVEVSLPMTLRGDPLPGTTDLIAFVYGPIVLAGRLGREGLAPGNQIIVNERESGNMLNAAVEVPVLVGDTATLVKRIRQDPHDPMTFRTACVGRPEDVELVPYYRLAHDRYNLYWRVVPA
jgi:DUF1680 family protein